MPDIKTPLIAAALTLALAGPAWAGSCPKIMASIDAALAKNPSISAEQMSQVTELRAKGEADHKAGKHADSVSALNEAKKILGLQ